MPYTIIKVYIKKDTILKKGEGHLEILPFLDSSKNKAIYIQLYDYIRLEILNNNIKAFEKLPSIRRLAKDMSLSKTTVETAYSQLIMEGYVESKPHRGYFVKEIENYDIAEPLDVGIKNINDHDFKKINEKKVIDLNSLPILSWRKYYSQILKNKPELLLSYGDEQGELILRQEISKYLHRSRGVNCSANQVVIGAGTQNLLFLLNLLLKDSLKIVGVEEPGFKKASRLLKDIGIGICPIEVENEQIMKSLIQNNHIDLLYLTPSHQFPIGSVMPIDTRLEVLKWAQKENCYIIEDDYDSELRYKGNPIPSLQGIDKNGKVIYMGSISKVMTPALRISYMILPKNLSLEYQKIKNRYSQSSSKIDQLALAEMMIEGEFEKHIRKIRKLYNKKNEQLIYYLKKIFKNNIKIIGEETGLHILIEVFGFSKFNLEKWYDSELKIISIDEYYYSNVDKNLRNQYLVSYAGIEDENIEKIIYELYKRFS